MTKFAIRASLTNEALMNVDRSKVENYDLGSLRYVPIDKLAITRRYLRYSITSASAPA